jgi:hypothetical protein
MQQGGCLPNVSYSAPFTTATTVLYAHATSEATASVLPTAGYDGC